MMQRMPAKRDPLAQYRKKRSSGRSSEPAGRRRSARSKRPRFVVQKHDATSLHYDFRLDSLPEAQRQRGLREDTEPREVVCERPETLP